MKTKRDYFWRRSRSSEDAPSAASANVPGSETISYILFSYIILSQQNGKTGLLKMPVTRQGIG